MQIGYSKRFKKQLKKSPRQIKCAFRERLHLFIQNKHHRLLDNHELTGKWQPYKSINITGDWRAVYKEYDDGAIIFFADIGKHSQLYK